MSYANTMGSQLCLKESDADDDGPKLPVLEFVGEAEMWSMHDGKPRSKYFALTWTDGDDIYLLGDIKPEVYLSGDVDLAKLSKESMLVPRSCYQAIAPDDLIAAPSPPPEDSYLKFPDPCHLVPGEDDEDTVLADTYLREARVSEFLMKNPHPNICEYRGYIGAHGRIKGLCVKRYGRNLYCAKRDGDDFDADRVMDSIRAGLAHLHGLGYAHNDLNPTNVVLDPEAHAVIIDFGSCIPIGSLLSLCYGTPPWTNEAKVSSEENDRYGLEKMDVWIHRKFGPPPGESGTDDSDNSDAGDSDSDVHDSDAREFDAYGEGFVSENPRAGD
ncbi:hypothetical protein OF83DRAFT_1177914 [Amylostereum chailletii]|nr:hypothetical protein OF83DRAFT_1177914 [Amylostereum chailletii]